MFYYFELNMVLFIFVVKCYAALRTRTFVQTPKFCSENTSTIWGAPITLKQSTNVNMSSNILLCQDENLYQVSKSFTLEK